MDLKRAVLPVILTVAFGCTSPVPVTDQLEEAYRYVWTQPEHALSLLEPLEKKCDEADERALYRLTYSIAARMLEKTNPYDDLTEVIGHYRTKKDERYLFVAIVHQAQLSGTQGKYKEALELLQRGSVLETASAPPRARSLYHSIHAFIYRRSGDYEKALRHYRLSQAINLEEGLDDLTVSNAINMVNLPGGVSGDSLARFIEFYEPYINKASTEHRCKFYNNTGNELKRNGDTLSAMSMYLKAMALDNSARTMRTRLNYAQLLDCTGHTEQAESIYSIVFLQADSTVLHRLYHHLTGNAIKQGNVLRASRYMNVYLEAVNNLYETRDRKELLEMQAKYDRSELMRKAEHNRNVVLKFLLSFVAISIASYGIYSVSRIYRCARLGNYLSDYCRLMSEYRQSHQAMEQKERENTADREKYRQQMDVLMSRIDGLMKESNRFRTIYRIKTPYMTVTPEDISALNLYLQLSGGKLKYEAACHRSGLYHWLNLTDGRFAERLAKEYPQLSQHDMDLCCFYRLGFDNDHISGLYGQYSDSIRRHRQRLYPLLGVTGKESLDELLQRF